MKQHSLAGALRQGGIIFVFLAVLTALEFFIAVAIDAIILLVAVAVIKVGLVMYYYMHIYKLNQDAGEDRSSLSFKTGTSRLGLWLFLLSDSFVFGGLAVARFNLLGINAAPSQSGARARGDGCAPAFLVLHEPRRDFHGARRPQGIQHEPLDHAGPRASRLLRECWAWSGRLQSPKAWLHRRARRARYSS